MTDRADRWICKRCGRIGQFRVQEWHFGVPLWDVDSAVILQIHQLDGEKCTLGFGIRFVPMHVRLFPL